MSVHSELIRGPVYIFGLRFDEWDTGGGCVALGHQLDDGGQLLITGYNEAYLPTRTDWSIGVYAPDGSPVRFCYSNGTSEVAPGASAGCPECARSNGPRYTGPCAH